MKLYTFSLFLILSLAFSIGCGTENPLCTDSFCIVPRDTVEGEVIEIDESKVLALIAKTTEVDQPPMTPVAPPMGVSLSDIITDVAAGNTTYLDQTVTITAYVVFKNDVGDTMVIHETPNVLELDRQGARLFILSKVDNDPLEFARYRVGSSYTFTLTINIILPPTDDEPIYLIGANLAG